MDCETFRQLKGYPIRSSEFGFSKDCTGFTVYEIIGSTIPFSFKKH